MVNKISIVSYLKLSTFKLSAICSNCHLLSRSVHNWSALIKRESICWLIGIVFPRQNHTVYCVLCVDKTIVWNSEQQVFSVLLVLSRWQELTISDKMTMFPGLGCNSQFCGQCCINTLLHKKVDKERMREEETYREKERQRDGKTGR